MKLKMFKKRIPFLIVALFLIISIAAVYIYQLNKTVSSTITENIREIAIHDQSSIENNIENMWGNLEHIESKLLALGDKSLEDYESLMNVECANSDFSHIYLVAEDGKIYTDKFVTYNPENEGRNGRMNLLPFFDDGGERVVSRFDDKVQAVGLTKESILYGIRTDSLNVDGISIVGLVGISDIKNIQDSLVISTYDDDGNSRGYSSVIDMYGDYIVNVEKSVYVNNTDNFFSNIDGYVKSGLGSYEIEEKMADGETFSFFYTNEDGIERLAYCMPFEQEDIDWYFISSVETTVFAEQNRMFLTMSMIMVASIVIVIIVMLVVAVVSQNKVIKANAEADARTAFLANMSHEIRTPLNGIIGLLYLLERDTEGDMDRQLIRSRISKAKNTAEYLLNLINNVLDVSKLQDGGASMNYEKVSPGIILDAVWSMQKNAVEGKDIAFNVSSDIKAPWIISDELALKQVLLNMVSNATKFTPAGGRITLSVTQEITDEKNVDTIFTCADTGCGMSQDFMEHIWDNFSQERNSTDESIKGTGLGMTISKLLVDALGGEIDVRSKIGEGSTFIVRIHSEIAERPSETDKRDIAEEIYQSDRSLKILVAEDNELNAEILLEILQSRGFDVLYAKNGRESVDIFAASAEGEIDAVLMDMQMPVMDGCTATREIRKLNRQDAKTVSIFACTANTFNEDREKAVASGMNDFLTKPIDINQLLKKLGGESLL
jgi:signal transduction histidine kinase/CheY-like chemotaxis protein